MPVSRRSGAVWNPRVYSGSINANPALRSAKRRDALRALRASGRVVNATRSGDRD
jgi:hypothetical protein